MLKQKEMPAVGEKVAVIKTDKGDIKGDFSRRKHPKRLKTLLRTLKTGTMTGLYSTE